MSISTHHRLRDWSINPEHFRPQNVEHKKWEPIWAINAEKLVSADGIQGIDTVAISRSSGSGLIYRNPKVLKMASEFP